MFKKLVPVLMLLSTPALAQQGNNPTYPPGNAVVSPENPNTVFAGPATGTTPQIPSWRGLTLADLQATGCVGYIYFPGTTPSCSAYLNYTTGININGAGSFGSFFIDNAATFSPYELVIQNSVSGNNTLQIRNTNLDSFAAIGFRGPNGLDISTSNVYERMAVGYAPAGAGVGVAGEDYIEVSNYDGTSDPGKPPGRFTMKATGGVDPTGGVTMSCTLVSGNPTISCPFAVPVAVSNLYVWGFNIPYDTQILSGGGTTTPTLTNAPRASATETVHFWYPYYAQRDFFQATADDAMFFQAFDGSILLNMNRIEKNTGIYGGLSFSTRPITGAVTTDTAALTDNFILWNSTQTTAKTQNIPGCTSAIKGQTMTIVDEANTAATYNITVTPASGQIQFSASKLITTNGGSMRIVCDGVQNWVPY